MVDDPDFLGFRRLFFDELNVPQTLLFENRYFKQYSTTTRLCTQTKRVLRETFVVLEIIANDIQINTTSTSVFFSS